MKLLGLLSGFAIIGYAVLRFIPDWYQRREAKAFEADMRKLFTRDEAEMLIEVAPKENSPQVATAVRQKSLPR